MENIGSKRKLTTRDEEKIKINSPRESEVGAHKGVRVKLMHVRKRGREIMREKDEER